MKREKHLGFRIDGELDYKLKYVASYDGRSIAGQVIQYIRLGIRAFEEEHGKIPYPPEEEAER